MSFEVKPSPIHGVGVFVTEDIEPDTILYPFAYWHDQELWWVLIQNSPAKFVNHSYKNNVYIKWHEGLEQLVGVALKKITKGEELLLDYDLHPTGIKRACDYDPPLK